MSRVAMDQFDVARIVCGQFAAQFVEHALLQFDANGFAARQHPACRRHEQSAGAGADLDHRHSGPQSHPVERGIGRGQFIDHSAVNRSGEDCRAGQQPTPAGISAIQNAPTGRAHESRNRPDCISHPDRSATSIDRSDNCLVPSRP